jgi:tetratricopeptide (TPR) repeat protein
MPGRIEKTVFISYRRTNLPWALCIYQNLTMHGYDVFFDYQSINSGSFEKFILENIKARAHFIVILTPSALERCKNPGDWLRREIETAIDENRNIVPLMLEGFDFGSPFVRESLTGKLALLSDINALPVPDAYALEAMDRLRERFLNVALSDVHLPALQADTEKATEIQKTAANEAAPVSDEQLTAQTWFERGYVFAVETKNPEEAIRCFSEAIRLDPNLDAAYNNLGILLKDLKRYDEAEAAYRKAIDLNPEDATAYYNLGILLKDLKRYDEAEAAYRKAIDLNPEYATAYNNLGNTLKDLKRYDEAEAAHRKAIDLNPENATAYNNLGNTLNDLKRYDEAEAAHRKAIDLNPENATAYYNLGILLKDLKRYDEAEAAYRKAIDLNPEDATAYNNLGILLKDLKRYDEAEAAYRKAIDLNPKDATAYNNLGILLNDLKRYDEAEATYHKAIDLNPEDATAYNNLIILLRFTNRIHDALPLLEKLIEIAPEDFNPYLALASIEKQSGAGVSAEHIKKARQLMPEEDLYNRACLESVCDNFDMAFEYLGKAAQREKFNPTWAWQDPDFRWIRDDPRFTEIMGPKPEQT